MAMPAGFDSPPLATLTPNRKGGGLGGRVVKCPTVMNHHHQVVTSYYVAHRFEGGDVYVGTKDRMCKLK